MRFTASLVLLLAGCSRFVWNEDPFTPDPAPVSEIIATGRDTTYVLRGPSYYLLTSQRPRSGIARWWMTWRGATERCSVRRLHSCHPTRHHDRRARFGHVAWCPLAAMVLPRRGDANRDDRSRPLPSVTPRPRDFLPGRCSPATAAEAWLRRA